MSAAIRVRYRDETVPRVKRQSSWPLFTDVHPSLQGVHFSFVDAELDSCNGFSHVLNFVTETITRKQQELP